MRMREERKLKKMLLTKMEGKRPRELPRTRWIDQIRKDIEMRGEKIGKIYKKTGNGTIEMAGDFSVIVDPYFWGPIKNAEILILPSSLHLGLSIDLLEGLPVKILSALLPSPILLICFVHFNLIDLIILTILGELY